MLFEPDELGPWDIRVGLVPMTMYGDGHVIDRDYIPSLLIYAGVTWPGGPAARSSARRLDGFEELWEFFNDYFPGEGEDNF